MCEADDDEKEQKLVVVKHKAPTSPRVLEGPEEEGAIVVVGQDVGCIGIEGSIG